jgi:hypothetical protein
MKTQLNIFSKKNTHFIFACITVIGLTLSSCQKDPGPAGPAGAPGTNGLDGKDGNANVKSQNIFITGSEWINDVAYSYVTKQVSEITADIVSKGVVMVYEETSSGVWTALPTSVATSLGYVFTYGFQIENGKLKLEITVNDNITLTAADIGNITIRVVVIPASALVKNPNLDLNDIGAVEKIALY